MQPDALQVPRGSHTFAERSARAVGSSRPGQDNLGGDPETDFFWSAATPCLR